MISAQLALSGNVTQTLTRLHWKMLKFKRWRGDGGTGGAEERLPVVCMTQEDLLEDPALI